MLSKDSPNRSGTLNLHGIKCYGHPLGVTCECYASPLKAETRVRILERAPAQTSENLTFMRIDIALRLCVWNRRHTQRSAQCRVAPTLRLWCGNFRRYGASVLSAEDT